MVAGEAVFGLPFHVGRYFRPTFVEVFQITQTQLGVLGSIYGVIAMGAYLLGGGLADRYSPRALLTFSLLTTGMSGFCLAAIPSYSGMCALFAFWGFSTILPFWSALIKATREWGGSDEQGEAFGLLDGGRGLFASVLAMVALFFFSQLLPAGGVATSPQEQAAALRAVILVYTSACFGAALLVWLTIPSSTRRAPPDDPSGPSRARLTQVLRMPTVWLQAAVIVAAYCTYKSTDYLSQYARDIWGWSEVKSAGLSAYSSWMRPVAAIVAGLLADRLAPSRVVIGCFALTGATFLGLVGTPPTSATAWLLWVNVLAGCWGIFALRGVYFALLEEGQIPRAMTGTAVGVISFIGFTPEIFMPLLGGWLIDRWAGAATGYHVLFLLLCGASAAGVVATLALRSLHGAGRNS